MTTGERLTPYGDTYRGILSTLWDDEYIVSLADTRQVAFFIFLLNNKRQSPAGFYKATTEQLWADFRRRDVTLEQAREWLLDFHEAGKVVSDRGYIWVVNFMRHRRELNPNIVKGVVACLNNCTSKLIFDGWMKKYRYYATLPEFFDKLATQGHVVAFKGPTAVGETNGGPPMPPLTVERPIKYLFDAEVRVVWEFYCATMDVEQVLTATRRDKIISRLKDKIADPETEQMRAVTTDDLMRAIGAFAHAGAKGSLEESILRDQAQLERWLATTTQPTEVVLEDPAPAPRGVKRLVRDLASKLDATSVPRSREAREESSRDWMADMGAVQGLGSPSRPRKGGR